MNSHFSGISHVYWTVARSVRSCAVCGDLGVLASERSNHGSSGAACRPGVFMIWPSQKKVADAWHRQLCLFGSCPEMHV